MLTAPYARACARRAFEQAIDLHDEQHAAALAAAEVVAGRGKQPAVWPSYARAPMASCLQKRAACRLAEAAKAQEAASAAISAAEEVLLRALATDASPAMAQPLGEVGAPLDASHKIARQRGVDAARLTALRKRLGDEVEALEIERDGVLAAKGDATEVLRRLQDHIAASDAASASNDQLILPGNQQARVKPAPKCAFFQIHPKCRQSLLHPP